MVDENFDQLNARLPDDDSRMGLKKVTEKTMGYGRYNEFSWGL